MSEPAQKSDPVPEPAPVPPQSLGSARRAGAPARSTRRKWAGVGRRVLTLLIAAAAIIGTVLVWMPQPVPMELTKAQRGPLLVTVDEDGRTRVKDRYVVSAPLLANLARVELTPGDAVEPGTVLARLVPLQPPLLDARTRAQAEARVQAASAARSQADAAIKRIETALEFAGREAQRQRQLIGSGAATTSAAERAELEERTLREELTSAQFGARVAAHDLQQAKAAFGRLHGSADQQTEQLELTSPVAGRVLRVFQQSEGAVQPGTPLLEIGDPAALEIVVDVLTSDAVHIRPGARAWIERWGGEQALRAHVRVVEPSAFSRVSALGVEEQRVNVVLDLDEPREVWAALGDGYQVEARIAVWEGDDVLSVPASAVFRRDQSWALFEVQDGVARVTTVELGKRNPDRVEVRSGLQAGDEIVAYPSERVTDGSRVAAR
jgi:HlyD family secretion protein